MFIRIRTPLHQYSGGGGWGWGGIPKVTRISQLQYNYATAPLLCNWVFGYLIAPAEYQYNFSPKLLFAELYSFW